VSRITLVAVQEGSGRIECSCGEVVEVRKRQRSNGEAWDKLWALWADHLLHGHPTGDGPTPERVG
jgi:hypothetical protein